jgi:hypothetical protein
MELKYVNLEKYEMKFLSSNQILIVTTQENGVCVCARTWVHMYAYISLSTTAEKIMEYHYNVIVN